MLLLNNGFVTYPVPFQSVLSLTLCFAAPWYFQSGEEDVPKLGARRDELAKKKEKVAECPCLKQLEPWVQVYI